MRNGASVSVIALVFMNSHPDQIIKGVESLVSCRSPRELSTWVAAGPADDTLTVDEDCLCGGGEAEGMETMLSFGYLF